MTTDVKVYVNQPLTIAFQCKTTISAAVAHRAIARSPSGTVLSLGASIQGTNELLCSIPKNILSEAGDWRLHAIVDLGDGEIPGGMAELAVHELFT